MNGSTISDLLLLLGKPGTCCAADGTGFGSMAGKVKQLIDRLIELRTKGERGLVAPLKIKLIMKGVDPDLYDESSPDSPLIMQRVISIAHDLGYDIG